MEKEVHYYKVDHEHLRKLGFKPTRRIEETLEIMIKDLFKYRDRVFEKSETILPKTTWDGALAKDAVVTSSAVSDIQTGSVPHAHT